MKIKQEVIKLWDINCLKNGAVILSDPLVWKTNATISDQIKAKPNGLQLAVKNKTMTEKSSSDYLNDQFLHFLLI